MWLYHRRAWNNSAGGGAPTASKTAMSAWEGTYLQEEAEVSPVLNARKATPPSTGRPAPQQQLSARPPDTRFTHTRVPGPLRCYPIRPHHGPARPASLPPPLTPRCSSCRPGSRWGPAGRRRTLGPQSPWRQRRATPTHTEAPPPRKEAQQSLRSLYIGLIPPRHRTHTYPSAGKRRNSSRRAGRRSSAGRAGNWAS